MQTFLRHPLTPKCTWPSQNKSKKTPRKYWENFFRNYAPFYIQGVGIFTEITVQQKTMEITWLYLHLNDGLLKRVFQGYDEWRPITQKLWEKHSGVCPEMLKNPNIDTWILEKLQTFYVLLKMEGSSNRAERVEMDNGKGREGGGCVGAVRDLNNLTLLLSPHESKFMSPRQCHSEVYSAQRSTFHFLFAI